MSRTPLAALTASLLFAALAQPPHAEAQACRRRCAAGEARDARGCCRDAGATGPEAEAAELLALLDGDAPALAVARPRAEGAIWGWLRSLDGMMRDGVAGARQEVSAAYVRALGLDPLGAEGWAVAGLDPASPIVASILALDAPAAERAYRALAEGSAAPDPRALARVPSAFWRSRIVARIADEPRLRRALAGLPSGAVSWVSLDAAGGDVAGLLGAPARERARLRATFLRAGVAVVGRLHDARGDVLVFARVRPPHLLVDVLQPYANLSIDWRRDGKAVLAHLARKPAAGGAASVVGAGAGRSLATADLAFWLDPGRSLDTARALGRENILGALAGAEPAGRSRLRQEGEAEVDACEGFRPAASAGPFRDAALVFRAEPSAFTLSAVWGLRPAAALGASLVAADDGLIDLAAASDAVVVGAVFLAGLKPLRALPRPGVYGQGLAAVTRSVELCGFGGALSAGVFGWPLVAAAALDAEAAGTALSGAALEGVRNVALALRDIDLAGDRHVGVAAASFEAAARGGLDPLIDGLLGPGKPRRAGGRALHVWRPAAADAPWAVRAPLAGGGVAYGVSLGGADAIDWYWGRPGPRPTAGTPPLLAAGRLDLPRLLEGVGRANPLFGPVAGELGRHLGPLSGSLQVLGDSLVASASLSIRHP